MRKRNMFTSAVLAVAATVGVAAPALAIDSVVCWPDNNWLRIYFVDNSGLTISACFANAGTAYTDFPRSYAVRAGNNNGNVEFIDTDGVVRYRPFSRGEQHSLPSVRVIKATIY